MNKIINFQFKKHKFKIKLMKKKRKNLKISKRQKLKQG